MNLEPGNNAIERANSALNLIEQLDLLVSNLTALKSQISILHAPELGVYIETLKSIIKSLDDSDIDESLINYKPVTSVSKNKIDRLRMGGEIVRLSATHTLKEIADKLQVEHNLVERFMKFYNKAKPSEKAKIHTTSIFDTQHQYEELNALIYRQLARFETQGEVHVKYIAELRQTLVAAQKWMESVSERTRLEQIKEIVAAILIDELPEKREQIIHRFAQAEMNTMNPKLLR